MSNPNSGETMKQQDRLWAQFFYNLHLLKLMLLWLIIDLVNQLVLNPKKIS